MSLQPPLLLIDVDGVISLFGYDPRRPPPGVLALVDGVPHLLSSTAGPLLASLRSEFELVWCTGWEERAAEHLPAALGLPGVVDHVPLGSEPASGDGGRHWKLDAIDAHVGRERPLAWIDDAFDETCHHWARARPVPTELIATDPAVGLTAAQARHLQRWAGGLRAGSARLASGMSLRRLNASQS